MNSSKKAVVVIILIILVGIVAYFLSSDKSENEQENITQFTSTEVSQHSSADDCWTIIDGKVYDITTYVPRHPGGNEIQLACGTDGSSLFNNRTTAGGEKIGSGTPHNSNAASQLSSLQIGELTTN